jgi:hypothetical protein
MCIKLLPFNIPSLIESNPDSLPVKWGEVAIGKGNEIPLSAGNKTHVRFSVAHRHCFSVTLLEMPSAIHDISAAKQHGKLLTRFPVTTLNEVEAIA